MAILNFNVQSAGQSNLIPQKITVQTDNASGDITGAGFLNPIVAQGFPIYNGDFAFISYVDGSALYTASVAASGIVTLTEYGAGSGGTVTFTSPSIANNIATWSNTTGNLQNGGAIGTAASKAASNAAQSTLASTAGSGFTANHVVTAGDAAGSIQDGGVLVSALQVSANIKAGNSGAIGNGTATSNAVTVAGLTAASVVVANILTSTSAVELISTNVGSGSFTVTLSATQAALTISYIAFIAAQ